MTIGSVMSPIGNPQNLLVALGGNIASPFTEFIKYLLVPTIINLFIAYMLIKLFYEDDVKKRPINHREPKLRDKRLQASLNYLFC